MDSTGDDDHQSACPGRARPPDPVDGPREDREEPALTQRYLDLVRSIHREWDALDRARDTSVMLSPRALSSLKESVRADARRGPQVELPPTAAGTYSVSTQALHRIVRTGIDAVPGARALRSSVEYREGGSDLARRGIPRTIRSRITVRLGTPDLLQLAARVRISVLESCRVQLGLDDLRVDIHIEDFHGHHPA